MGPNALGVIEGIWLFGGLGVPEGVGGVLLPK